MKRILLICFYLWALLLTGCLDFGKDEQTSSPSPAQVGKCRAEMHLKPSLVLVPLGFKLDGSGIDDAIWFKFKTNASDPSEVFDTSIVNVRTFKNGFTFFNETKEISWWDVSGKDLFGEQVDLPNARVMNVGMQKVSEGYIVYIMWHET